MKITAATSATVPLSADVIRRAQQGDSDAFATLFHAHKTRVYSLCLRMTNNVTEAEDLAQDAFLQVFRKLATFRGDSALSTWLHRIAVNTVLMHFRRKSPRAVSLDDTGGQYGDAPAIRRECSTRDGRLETSVNRLALTRAISELPEGYRTIFLLHEVDGYEHREIAEFLGCSVGNSKSQLHKAKLRMRELLKTSGKTVAATRPLDKGNGRSARRPVTPVTVEQWKMPIRTPASIGAVGLGFAHSNA